MATQAIPKHIGIIADGNRRWAKQHGLPSFEGHRRGADRVEALIEGFEDSGVEFLSFFLFSTENWQRSPEEVDYLMKLTSDFIARIDKKLQKHNVRVLIMGRKEPISPKLWQKLQDIEQSTQNNTGMTVCLCFNYGGQYEIVDAAAKMLAAGEQDFSPASFRKYLYHPEVPDCDLIVRSGGDQRTSGFQLWRAAYSEFMFLDKTFPDMDKTDCVKILNQYQNRDRRFGK